MDNINFRDAHHRSHGPDLFFPIALITAGIIWLLINSGQIPADNLYRLIPYWPILLIASGVGLILRQIGWLLEGMMWLGLAAFTLWIVYSPNTLALPGASTTNAELRHETFHAPLNNATSAKINLDLSSSPAQIQSTSDSNDLVTADVHYYNSFRFDDRGQNGSREVTLSAQQNNGINLPAVFFASNAQDALNRNPWLIGLNAKTPLDLTIGASTGSLDANLKSAQLQKLNVDASTGSIDLTLPENSPSYAFTLSGSTGSIHLAVPSGAVFNLQANLSTGSLTVDLPKDAGVQVTLKDKGTGSLNLSSSFKKTKNDVWENALYAASKAPITLQLDMSTGSVDIR